MASDESSIYGGLISRGFNPAQAAALTGNIQQESSFDPDSTNKTSGAYGLLNWRGPRLQALQQYAQSTGRAVDDPDAQLDFIAQEMLGSEAPNVKAFLSSNDVGSANAALKPYIRYGNSEAGNRLQYAQAAAIAGPATQASTGANPMQFVNPANNGAMPAAPQLPAPAPLVAPAAQGAPASAAPVSDDDLLGAFTNPKPAGASTPNADDAFLAPFLKGSGPASAADPMASTQQLFPGADTLATVFEKGVDAIPIVGRPLMNALTDAKAGVQSLEDGSSLGNVLTGKGNVTAQQVQATDNAVTASQPVASAVGTTIGTVAPYLVGGAIPGVAKALGMSGNLLTRIGMGALSNAAIQGTDTITRGGSVNDAERNALIGGGIGAAAAPVADVIGAGVNKLLAGTSPQVAQLAQLARDKFNIPIGPGQISTNPMIRMADSVVNKMPLSGGTASTAAQQTAFNRAVANTFGATADQITPDVMASAKARIGNDFDTVAAQTPSIPYDNQLQAALGQTISDATSVLQPNEVAPIKNQVDAIVGKFAQGSNNGSINGQVYQALTAKGAPLDRLLQSDDPNIQFYAGQVRDALDDALSRNAPQSAQDLLSQARSQYKAMKTVEPLVAKSPTGDISAPLLMGRVNSSYGNVAYGGGGDLADLARIGQQFLKPPPSSGTAERLAVMEIAKRVLEGGGVAGGIGALAMNPGAIPMTLATGVPAALGYLGLAKGAGALLRSDGLANALIDNSLGTAARGEGGAINMLTRTAAGFSPGQRALVDDGPIGGLPAGPENGQQVQIVRQVPNGYIVQLPGGQQTFMGQNLLTGAPAQ